MPRFMMLMYPNVTEEQYEEGVRADWAFHTQIVALTGNAMLIRFAVMGL